MGRAGPAQTFLLTVSRPFAERCYVFPADKVKSAFDRDGPSDAVLVQFAAQLKNSCLYRCEHLFQLCRALTNIRHLFGDDVVTTRDRLSEDFPSAVFEKPKLVRQTGVLIPQVCKRRFFSLHYPLHAQNIHLKKASASSSLEPTERTARPARPAGQPEAH
jgi:hypothetical protein